MSDIKGRKVILLQSLLSDSFVKAVAKNENCYSFFRGEKES